MDWILERLQELESVVPSDLLVNFIDSQGIVRYVKSSDRLPFPVYVGEQIDDEVMSHTVAHRAWTKRQCELQYVGPREFGFPYLVGSFPLFDESHQFGGVLSVVLPADTSVRMASLQEERDIFQWLLRVAGDVFLIDRPDLLWGQFRDLFVQLFAIPGGALWVEEQGSPVFKEWFGSVVLSSDEREWMQRDACSVLPGDSGENRRVVEPEGRWILDRYDLS